MTVIPKTEAGEFTRRTFLRGTGGAVVLAAIGPARTAAGEAEAAPEVVPRTAIQVTVNGTTHRVEVEDRWTLVELLRDHLGLTGPRPAATGASAAPARC